jgi:hypothetical protein
MKMKLKENPKEWRKAAWFGALGMGVLSTVFRWRHVLPATGWKVVLASLAVVVVCAWRCPRWFRGYYRVSSRLAFFLTRWIGYAVLSLLFILVVTPLGWLLRLLGKDLLQIKGQREAATCWQPAKESTSLDRLF